MTNEEQKKQDRERVESHVQALMEYFDTVQIFVGRHMPAEVDGTVVYNNGGGNWLARRGQIHDWMIEADERVRVNARPHP